MFVIIDNYDSFTYNLVSYFQESGEEIIVKKNDKITIEEILKMKPRGIILSPGPKRPEDAGICLEVVKRFRNRVPMLGVCLGHQVIAKAYGGKVTRGLRPMHGKVSTINHREERLFHNVPQAFLAVRYHSLIVEPSSLPTEFIMDAWSEDQVVMAITHRQEPVFGVQFHPEAVLTSYGHDIVNNFIMICEEWWCQRNENSHKKAR